MMRRPPRSTQSRSSAASDVYKRQTYTITPTSSAGCVGNTFTATVIVRSEPVGVPTPASQTVCSDEAITPIVLSTSNSMAGTTYAWTRDNTTNITGLSNTGTGNISGTPNNVTGTDQTVTYTITPTSSAGCVGNTFTATVIVPVSYTHLTLP